MTIVETSCVAPSPAKRAVEAMVKLLGLGGSTTVTEGETLYLRVSTRNVLTGLTTTTAEATSWVGCVRALCAQVPSLSLWGDGKPESTAMIEGWIIHAETKLLPILLPSSSSSSSSSSPDDGPRGGTDDAAFGKAVVETMASKIDETLYESDRTYLIDDGGPTAADICLMIWLAQACQKYPQVKTLPQQCHRWFSTLCHHDALKEFVGSSTSSFPAEGDASPTTKPSKPITTKTTSTTTTTKTTTDGDGDGDFSTNSIVRKLVEWKIPHRVYSHALCHTADELVANVPVPDGDTHTKNLFFKDKKHGMFLVTVCTDSVIDTKNLGAMLQLPGKVNLRLADERTLMEQLGARPGCVGPLSIVADDAATKSDGGDDKKDGPQITLVLDKALMEKNNIHSHPLVNDASVILTPQALQDYIAKTCHEPVMVEFASAAGRGGAGAGTGTDGPKKNVPSPPPPSSAPAPAPKKSSTASAAADKGRDVNKKTAKKGETLLKLQWKKEENFPMWYSDVIVLSEMISYYDISGCYILRPWSYKIWELVQDWFNGQIQALGVENAYFPMFVSKDRLEKEKDHVEGFSPEVAWVTKSGDGDLAVPIAVRPTSETVMYPAFSDWIQSHRDLPLLLNQWCNIVRWEFKDPTPFLRTREFLWQEGHTAHATYDDANAMVRTILDLYRRVYEELMAVPVIPGYKTEKEKFAGGYQTTTVEAYISGSGRAIQGATSHNLGLNFGRMFEISFQDKDGKAQIPWQTSWGLTTRSMGVMIMVHGDDTGLVLPPRLAPLQAVIVPVISKNLTNDVADPYCEAILKDLQSHGIRAKYDDRTIYNPGWKYNHWEQKGVPIRIEVGPRDIGNESARIALRHNGEKMDLPIDGLGAALKGKLGDVQGAMFRKAREARDAHLVKVTEWKDFVPNLELNNLVLTPWCGGEHQEWEEWVKDTSKAESLQSRGEDTEDERAATSVAAKTLCIPFDQPDLPEGTKCIASGMPATCWVLWGRSY